ncbi:hypothetical protein GCM10009548_01590 [Streptomyces malaysiensis subsp. malaysiensis]|uniref:DUF4352 domain-containing protein n=1 Tax=Streptomyces malaysiensis TaxID=92644 RepID=A0ABX6W4E5_STRMQ|nr:MULTISPECIES: DUF4352 domain-containing protein [Streptomyces]QPI56370.1 DUF4352 domain-containing protein [Streptomyces solisilvae]UHH17857.1 DUF4352 domain-containing protein [Streptomyces sp. HNM0561]
MALLGAVLVGCSSDDGNDSSKPAPSAPATTQKAAEKSSSPSPSKPAAPVVAVGQTGTFDVGEADDYGENYKVTTQMQVTVVSAKYVTPAEVDTTNKPEQGQYIKLTLTLKNVGKAPAEIMTYGMMKWEDDKTAAQDASTLEGVGDGPDLDTTYKPGQSVTGSLVLDVGRRGGRVSYVGGDDPGEGPTFVVKLPK